jgi:phosphoglycolate phosphatase
MSAAAATGPQWRGTPLQAVLFDLDGTLLDTLDDITAALNQALAEQRLAPLTREQVRRLIGRGAALLIARALRQLGLSPPPQWQAALLQRYGLLAEQRQLAGRFSARTYPGVTQCLAELRALQLRLAVVTNKQQRLALMLLQRLGLDQWIEVVVGGDSCERGKPDPQPLLHACEQLQVAPAHCLMVGDSINDVLAARAAAMPVVCVPYGYNEGLDPRLLSCDAFVNTLAQLPAMLAGAAALAPRA